MTEGFVASVVIPAHQEEERIGRTLHALCDGDAALEVVVVCNGCTDRTADIARDAGVTVAELEESSKIAALRRGDQLATTYPRIYLDGDVVLSNEAAAALADALDRQAPIVAGVLPQLDLSGSSRLVRWYYDFRQRLPVFGQGIIGAGVYAMNEAGRRRFDDWPAVLGDDQFVFRLFRPHERVTVSRHRTLVEAPPDLRTVLRREIRVRRGNRGLSRGVDGRSLPAPAAGLAAAVGQAVAKPSAWPGLITWVTVKAVVRLWARLRPSSGDWQTSGPSAAAHH